MHSETTYFDSPNFVQEPRAKLDFYLTAAHNARTKLEEQLPQHDQAKGDASSIWQEAAREWRKNRQTYPNVELESITTSSPERLTDLYRKLDEFVNKESTDPADTVRIIFAASCGALVIRNLLVGHSSGADMMAAVGQPLIEAVRTAESLLFDQRDEFEDEVPATGGLPAFSSGTTWDQTGESSPKQVNLFDVLRYKGENGVVRTISIKDHCSTAMKGEFYIVTTILDEDADDGSADEEVPADIMEEWVERGEIIEPTW